ncbi:MAG: helix-hairpin-helix domain-containing protein [Deltaproteobacteria bacterium]|nr:helix-hairpin-helix domain-containing protein [Deltaproteobacteria bacterium]
MKRIGLLMELAGEAEFKSRAYGRAARTVEAFPGSLAELATQAEAGAVQGIGEALAQKIAALAHTGSLPFLTELEQSFPAGMTNLLDVSGLGPKTIRKLNKELGVQNLEDLERACVDDRVSPLPGLGKKVSRRFSTGPASQSYAGRFHLHKALAQAEGHRGVLRKIAKRVAIAGSVRRRMETIDRIDLVAEATDPKALLEAFAALPDVSTVSEKLDDRCVAVFQNGMTAALHVSAPGGFGLAFVQATGSADHYAALEERARERSVAIDAMEGDEEAAIYSALGLADIPAELREGLGEIEAAASGALPRLIGPGDLIGVVHAHTQYSDGTASVAGMAAAARALGYRYLALSDHSKSSTVAGGLKEDAVKRQHDEIDALNAKEKDFRILKGIESDILKDGSLDYDDDVLKASILLSRAFIRISAFRAMP